MSTKLTYKKAFLISSLLVAVSGAALGQQAIWSPVTKLTRIKANRAVQRQSFPKEFKLYSLNRAVLDEGLSSTIQRQGRAAVIALPNSNGDVEQYELYEASNFEPELQAKYPDIRAYSGRGVTDRYASVKLSVSPNGIQVTIFRTADPVTGRGRTEIIEPYSVDGRVYAVFRSERGRGQLPWACQTRDKKLFSEWSSRIAVARNAPLQKTAPESDTREIRVMRLAQSVNGEYSNYFGADDPGESALVLAAINATLTRTNGVYERDLGIHLNLIANSSSLWFYDPATDPYSDDLGNWNDELAGAIAAASITPAMYDIGHMFGASGGGGNAGCIGCVCSNNHDKGMGITSPADDIPSGDNFDIDYVAHEVGHQLGANHTFSYGQLPVPEDMGQDKEIGSGITIMGYAGISPATDIAAHSIDHFHETSIQQIQVNHTISGNVQCPGGTLPQSTNRPPVVAPVSDYTIPHSTPFALTGSATDPDGDALTYNWEQDDSAGNTGASLILSNAYPIKPTGPNYISFPSSSSPTRYFPKLATILAGQLITVGDGDPGMNSEALSSITRDLNFRLTVRDNSPYVVDINGMPTSIGQTNFTDMTVSVTQTAGPFMVTQPNSAVSWQGGTQQTITWDVASTTLAPVSTANVNIRLSLDGGLTFPIVLKANTPNDGTELVTLPTNGSTTARIMVEAAGNIFLDISDANFTILGTTAASASVGGRVVNSSGRGITGATIMLSAPDGSVRTATTNRGGYYVFDNVEIGRTYVIHPSQGRYRFSPETIMYNHFDHNSEQSFTASSR